MGQAWVDHGEDPKSAKIVIGDFCFLAGTPDEELVKNIPGDFQSEYMLMIPQTEEWSRLIEQVYQADCERFMRYAIKKEPDVFDPAVLNSYASSLLLEFELHEVNEELFYQVKKEEWSKDLCSQFKTYRDYEKDGLGFVVLHNGVIVSGASSYIVYHNGIEVEIDTREDYRRKGLALACASKLILECLDCGIYPSWDAANLGSVALSEKLGYHFEREYPAYAVKLF
jgi:Sortase and related acyltransferases